MNCEILRFNKPVLMRICPVACELALGITVVTHIRENRCSWSLQET